MSNGIIFCVQISFFGTVLGRFSRCNFKIFRQFYSAQHLTVKGLLKFLKFSILILYFIFNCQYLFFFKISVVQFARSHSQEYGGGVPLTDTKAVILGGRLLGKVSILFNIFLLLSAFILTDIVVKIITKPKNLID